MVVITSSRATGAAACFKVGTGMPAAGDFSASDLVLPVLRTFLPPILSILRWKMNLRSSSAYSRPLFEVATAGCDPGAGPSGVTEVTVELE